MLCEYITLMFCASQSWWNSLRRKPKHAKIACVGAITGQDDIPGIAALLYAGLSAWRQVTTLKLLLNVKVLYPYTIFFSLAKKYIKDWSPSGKAHTYPSFLFNIAACPDNKSCETLPSSNRGTENDVCEAPCQGFSLQVQSHVGETRRNKLLVNK